MLLEENKPMDIFIRVMVCLTVWSQHVAGQGCSQTTCGACVASGPECTWCVQGTSVSDPRSPGNCTSTHSSRRCPAYVNNMREVSEACSWAGVLTCHGCQCDTGFHGTNCECESIRDSDEFCKSRGDSAVCAGQGDCVCGQCYCHPVHPSDPSRRFSGQYCECNDYSCPYVDGLLCGGPTHGSCRCGQCMCQPDYVGESCGCSLSQDTCRDWTGKICGDHGLCQCGRCVCEEPYRGMLCEDCPTCPGRCEQSKPCVECVAFGIGPLNQEECEANCQNIRLVDMVDTSDENTRLCQFRDEDDCTFCFTYHVDSLTTSVQMTRECPDPRRYGLPSGSGSSPLTWNYMAGIVGLINIVIRG